MNDIEIIELIKGTELATFSIPRLGETTIKTDELKPMIEAWEKQIPKIAEYSEPFGKLKCPSCDEMYDAIYDEETGEPTPWFNFCPECGQAIGVE